MQITGDRIVRDLSSHGVNVKSIDELVNSRANYLDALPVLLGYLGECFDNSNVAEAVVRSLTIKEAKGLANKSLIRLYNSTPREEWSLRWSIGNAFTVLISDEDVPHILDIVNETDNGISRQMFVLSLSKCKNSSEILPTLVRLLDDDQVNIQALQALIRLRKSVAKSKVEVLRNHPNPVVRKLAIKYLKLMAI